MDAKTIDIENQQPETVPESERSFFELEVATRYEGTKSKTPAIRSGIDILKCNECATECRCWWCYKRPMEIKPVKFKVRQGESLIVTYGDDLMKIVENP